MSVVLIDARYYGQILRTARCCAHIRHSRMADILNISTRNLRLYERGREPIPEQILTRLLCNGMMTIDLRRKLKK